MKINTFALESSVSKQLSINGNVYTIGCITTYGGKLSGVRKYHLRPEDTTLECLSFIVWENNEYYRIVNDNNTWKDKHSK